MSRTRFIWDKELQAVVEIGAGSNRAEPEQRTPMQGVMRDLEPYRPVAADKETGKRPEYIGGRRQHREFLNRNGYIETGNEPLRNNLQFGPRPGEIAADIKRVLGD